jgi:cell division transport system permease protein
MKLLSITGTHIRRSPYQALAATLTMFLTMLLAGFFFVTSAALVFVLQYFEAKPQITVFFTDKTGAEEATLLQQKLEATGKTAGIKFVSKDDALAIYREQNKNDPLLLEMVTADILPASLEVSASDPSFLRELETAIAGAPGVEEVVYQQDVVDTLLAWTRAIRIIGGTLAGLLAIDSLLVVMTIIGMKIALKKTEVEILTLVGASPWYIRLPFLLEGGFYGVLGAFTAWGFIIGAILWLRGGLLTFLDMPIIAGVLQNPAAPAFLIPALLLLAIMIGVGFFLGVVGSFVAVGRYLRFEH